MGGGTSVKPITLVLPFYRNPTILVEQQRIWSDYPDELKARLHVVVVDDGSPKDHALPHIKDCGLASFQLYRVGVDVRWNWIFCRNLGASVAPTEWLLLTDIDHAMPAETLRRLTEDDHDAQNVYRLSRVDAPALTTYKPHPNTWFMTGSMFDKIGGYDERFSGYYGTDYDFRDRAREASRAIVMLPEVLIRYPREVIHDASTTTYGRKEQQDIENVARIRDLRARIENWRPLRLTFPFERLI